ncbi:putative ribonuclease h protein, partial [Nicotiana attenuata]
FKLNTDGSSMGRDKKVVAGGILRDHQGSMIMAFSVSMIFCSNNMAETQTANFGLQWYIDYNIKNFNLEMDSKILVDMIKGINKPSWKLHHWIAKIQEKQKFFKADVIHCYREANMVADSLAKFGAIEDASRIFSQINELPRHVKGAFILDKIGMPNFRIRSQK